MADYEVIIAGAGAAGCIAAGILCEAGKRVLLLERGRSLSDNDLGRDHLRNQRLSLYGHNAGPEIEGNPRVFVSSQGERKEVPPHDWSYMNNAATVGGGTRVYGGQAWRFHPNDFRMASEYGVPEGSSLSDWPLSYNDLEPFYERAEWEVGVCGDSEGNLDQIPRKRGFPMPPVSPNLQTHPLKRGADRLGWNTFAVPQLLNTVPYQGRPACTGCSYCVGFACQADAKNGTHNTFLLRALATGLCDLVTEAMTERIETDTGGRVTGVSYLKDEAGSLIRRTVSAKTIIVSSGATETPRLLLNSAASHHPAGLGNHSDQVGRHLQGHYYVGVWGLLDEVCADGRGPGPSITTGKFSHGNPGVIGGGMLLDDFVRLPIIHWYRGLPPDLPRWGKANKEWMRDNYKRTLHITGPLQDIPDPSGRITVDPTVKDRFGIPVVQISGTTHPETVKTADFMRERAIEWMQACGATKIWSAKNSLHISGGQHQAGTARMGTDPAASVTDPYGRVHHHDNLYVMDGSLHVTNGGFNPVLTIMALAIRNAEHLAKTL